MYASYIREHNINTTIRPSTSPSCFDCQNCEVVNVGKPDEFWCCETYGWGVPCKCDPPHDEPCKFFSRTERFDNDKFQQIIANIQQRMDD